MSLFDDELTRSLFFAGCHEMVKKQKKKDNYKIYLDDNDACIMELPLKRHTSIPHRGGRDRLDNDSPPLLGYRSSQLIEGK